MMSMLKLIAAQVLEAVDVLSAFYLAIAFYPVDKKNPASRDMNIKLGQIPEYRDVAKVGSLESTAEDRIFINIVGHI